MGNLAGEILIRAAGSDSAIVHRIPVHGTVRPAVFAVPPALYASRDPKAESPRLSVTISADDPEFALVAEPAPETGEGVEGHRRAQQRNRSLFDVAPCCAGGESIQTVLVFRTNRPEVPEVRIPVSLQPISADLAFRAR